MFSTLFTLRFLELFYGITIPILLYVDHYKVMYALGNISGPSDTPGTPSPGESFITVYFRVNNITGLTVELELLSPCDGRAIDPTMIGADGIPVSEIIKDGELNVVRTNQLVTVNMGEIAGIQRIDSSSLVSSCPLP